ncbi:MAG: AAA family ATPase [Methylacidiphilales bacterium]|nr:AAA family ATPase [Candidatus Methylacidiphilales bacterium]
MKIQKIILNNFRGFPGPLDYEFKLNGNNLLLFGENGSGKSSLYRALVELFQPDNLLTKSGAKKPFSSFRNAFARDNNNQLLATGKVRIEFDRPELTAEWSETQERSPHMQDAPTELNLTARSIGCLDYRAMLETNFVHRHGRVNLFSLIVEHLLAHIPISSHRKSDETLGIAWKRVLAVKPSSHRGSRWRNRVKNAEAFWNNTLPPLLGLLTDEVNKLLGDFKATGLTVKLTPGTLKYSETARKFYGMDVWLDATLNTETPEEPQHFLNEARLSALALSLFLAGYKMSIHEPSPGEIESARVLVLDDVLIGLDMDNRVPVLDILRNLFATWQILLLTHDRPWFEIAKQRLRPGGNWQAFEAYSRRVGDHEQPIVLDDSDLLLRALEYFEVGHVKSAAVYAREQFEVTLKWACETFAIPVRFRTSFRDVKANDLWTALKDAQRKIPLPAEYCTIAAGKTIRLPVKSQSVRIIPEKLVERVGYALSWVLNPLSHSEPVSRYSREIEDAIFAVDELDRTVRQSALDAHNELILQRRFLVGLLKRKPVSSEVENPVDLA